MVDINYKLSMRYILMKNISKFIRKLVNRSFDILFFDYAAMMVKCLTRESHAI